MRIYSLIVSFVMSLTLGGLGGCLSSLRQSGVELNQKMLKEFVVGKTKKSDVQQALGSPSFTLPPSEDLWCYVSRIEMVTSYGSRELKDASTLVLSFAPDGVLSKMEYFNKDQMINISPCPETTPTTEPLKTLGKKFLRILGPVTPMPATAH